MQILIKIWKQIDDLIQMINVKNTIKIINATLLEDKKYVKKHIKEYIIQVEIVLKVLEIFIEDANNEFKYWCSENINLNFELWESPNSIFINIFNYIKRFNYELRLNLLAIKISKAKKYQKNLDSIMVRLNQIKYIC